VGENKEDVFKLTHLSVRPVDMLIRLLITIHDQPQVDAGCDSQAHEERALMSSESFLVSILVLGDQRHLLYIYYP